jgi:hypothetical protein
MVPNNDNPKLNEVYAFDYTEGIMVVAIPHKNSQTMLEFDYWIDAYDGPSFFSFRGENAQTDLIFFCSCILLLTLLLSTIIHFIWLRLKKDDK